MKDVNLLKENGIDVEHGLELLGDLDMYEETLEDFLTESEERLPQLEVFKNVGDMSNYAILVHAMKSDSKYLGFTQLAEMSYQHELESKENHIDFVNNHYDELLTEVNRIISIVKKYLGK